MKWKGKSILVLFLLLFVGGMSAKAQIMKATVGINGLTCSQCSRSVLMELNKLPFVSKVDMNLEHTLGQVYFKNGEIIDVQKLAQAVTDAGFSVRFLDLTFNFSKLDKSLGCFVLDDQAFYFLNSPEEGHREEMTFQIIANGFMPKSEFRKYTLKPNGACLGKEKYYLGPAKS